MKDSVLVGAANDAACKSDSNSPSAKTKAGSREGKAFTGTKVKQAAYAGTRTGGPLPEKDLWVLHPITKNFGGK